MSVVHGASTDWVVRLKPLASEWGVQWVHDLAEGDERYDIWARTETDGTVRAVAHAREPGVVTHKRCITGAVVELHAPAHADTVRSLLIAWCRNESAVVGTPTDWTTALHKAARLSLALAPELTAPWLRRVQSKMIDTARKWCPLLDDADVWAFAPDAVVCCEEGLFLKDPLLRFIWVFLSQNNDMRRVPYTDSKGVAELWRWALGNRIDQWRLAPLSNDERASFAELVTTLLENIFDADDEPEHKQTVAPPAALGNVTGPLADVVRVCPPCIRALIATWTSGTHLHYEERKTLLLFLRQAVADKDEQRRLWYEAARNDPNVRASSQSDFYAKGGKIQTMMTSASDKTVFARGCKSTIMAGQCPHRQAQGLADIEDVVRASKQQCAPFTFSSPVHHVQKAMTGGDAPSGCVTS
jgi:hypothetical protein